MRNTQWTQVVFGPEVWKRSDGAWLVRVTCEGARWNFSTPTVHPQTACRTFETAEGATAWLDYQYPISS